VLQGRFALEAIEQTTPTQAGAYLSTSQKAEAWAPTFVGVE
jgi:hypothetical protein